MRREPRPRLLTGPFLAVTVANFLYEIALGAALPALPVYVDGELGAGSIGVGAAVGAFTVTALVLRPISGRLGDRYGRRPLLVFGAAAVVVASVGMLWATSLAAVIALRLVTGAGEATFFVGAMTAVTDLAPPERRGEAVSLFSISLFGGLGAGPFLGESVLLHFGFDWVWGTAAIAAAAALVLSFRIPDTRDPSALPSGARPEHLERVPLMRRILHPAALLPGGALLAQIWGFSGFLAFIPLYARELGLEGSRFVLLELASIMLAVRVLGARLPDRLGAARTARAAMTVAGAGLLIVGTWRTVPGLFFGTGVFALGQALAFPSLMTMTVERAPAGERGAAVGSFSAFFDLAFGVGSLSLGAVASVAGYAGTFVVGGLIAVAGLAVLTLAGAPAAEKKVRTTAPPSVPSVHGDSDPP